MISFSHGSRRNNATVNRDKTSKATRSFSSEIFTVLKIAERNPKKIVSDFLVERFTTAFESLKSKRLLKCMYKSYAKTVCLTNQIFRVDIHSNTQMHTITIFHTLTVCADYLNEPR